MTCAQIFALLAVAVLAAVNSQHIQAGSLLGRIAAVSSGVLAGV